jgi:hypothetical protein
VLEELGDELALPVAEHPKALNLTHGGEEIALERPL